METKVFRRFVYVIEVYKDSEFLGYYTGRDSQNNIHYDKRVPNAMIIINVSYAKMNMVHIN